ncbi:TIGR03619 family F420-dependent LLM class oxidoreductase [Winogradskya humida]|uniref:TIGR03619 family F420-dependent LLM class oxidoreductase n=1 Tax=Winogradskya humida TaxID=113566 RepID=UPI0027DE1212|nr:TIGR03619 family F420-dependent LLM class oxidoreductase [Actinoplanes humidus]
MIKFAVSYSPPFHGVDPDTIVGYAQHAEQCGFEAIYVPEHIVLHPGARLGTFELPPDLPYLDPLDCLSFIAAATSRILLGTAVLLLPYHHPVTLAKRLATVDVLSKGRMRLLTVGLGALPGEAAAVGVDYASRGRRADEAIDVLRSLWAGDERGVSFHGEFFDFDGLCSFPKPYQAATLPIHVGGSSRAAARRAALRGDGFYPGGMLTPDERAAQWELAGRPQEYTRPAALDITAERVAELAAQGVTRLVVSSTSLDDLTAFASRFV